MPSQTGTGFASGFVGAMAQALGAKQERGRQEEQKSRERSLQLAKLLIDSGQVGSFEELQPLLGHWNPEMFGDKAKKPKAGQMDPAKTIGDVLNKSLQSSNGQPMLPGPAATQKPTPNAPAPSGENLQPGGALDTGAPTAAPAALQSSQVAIPAAAPQQRTLAGVPLMTPEQAAQRKLGISIAGEEATINAKVALARRILPTLQAVDKSATLDDALATVGIRMPSSLRAGTPQSVAGEINGKPAFGVFVPELRGYVKPGTTELLEGFVPKATGGAGDLGDLAERAAISLGFPSAQAAGRAGQMDAVNKKAAELAGQTSGARTEASTTARTQVEAKAPLSSSQRFNALRELQGDWRKAEAPEKETSRQLQIMETGLKRFKEGDKNGGSQAVLVTFQKILDPQSVVRESEYDRSPEGLGLKQRFQGFLERLQTGGAGVPEAELDQMVQTAREFVKGMADYNTIERERITSAAKEAGLEPDRVFGVAAAGQKKDTGGGTAAPAGQLPAPKGMEWVNGQLMIKK